MRICVIDLDAACFGWLLVYLVWCLFLIVCFSFLIVCLRFVVFDCFVCFVLIFNVDCLLIGITLRCVCIILLVGYFSGFVFWGFVWMWLGLVDIW